MAKAPLDFKKFYTLTAVFIIVIGSIVWFLPHNASAAVAFRSVASAENGAGATTLTINAPAGATTGDILVAAITVNQTTNGYSSFSIPVGWTSLASIGDGGNSKLEVSYTVLSSAPNPSYSFNPTALTCVPTCARRAVSDVMSGAIVAYSGVDTVTPIDTSATLSNTTASTSITAPSVTTTKANDLILVAVGEDSGATITAAGGATIRSSLASTGGGASTTKACTGLEDKTIAATGATGTFSATSSTSATSEAATIAISPASVANAAPNAPTLASPSSAANSIALTPTFTLSATDPNSDYVQYKILLYQSDCATLVSTIDETNSQTGWSGQNAQTNTAYTSGSTATYTYQSSLSANTTYCWKAAAIDPGGSNTFGAYSATQSFTTNASPAAPTLSTPASAATNVSVTPTFTLRTTDANGDYLRYKILLYQSDCSTLVGTFDEASTQTGWSGQDQQTGTAYTGSSTLASSTIATYTYQGLLANSTTYCWKAAAIDPGGTNTFSSFSATQSFTTVAPTVSVILSGGTNIAGGVRFGN